MAYGVFVAVYESDTSAAATFPTFNPPSIAFEEIPDGCGGFFDCTEFVGKVIVNIVLGVVYFVLLIVALLVFIVAFLAIVASSAFTGIDGMPAWGNAIILGIFGAALAVIIFKMTRKGDSSA